MTRACLVVALLVGLSGCVGVPDGTDASAEGLGPGQRLVLGVPADVLRPPQAYGLECPASAGTRTVGDVCVGTFEHPTDTYNEPFVAIHPSKPDVYAIGMNVLRAPPVFLHGTTAHVCLVDYQVAFTEDGGETWRLTTLPPMPDAMVGPQGLCLVGDPALVFDEEGSLYISGVYAHAWRTADDYRIFFTSTDDLGRSWKTPVMVSDDAWADRNWISLGPDGTLYVPWSGETGKMAFGFGKGATWSPDGVLELPCVAPSPLVFQEDAALFSCSSPDRQIQVYEVDAAGMNLMLRGEPAGVQGVITRLVQLPDRSLGLVQMNMPPREETASWWWTRSFDGGATWTDAIDLRDLATVDDAWDAASVNWAEPDPWGGVHFLVRGYDAGPYDRDVAEAREKQSVAHLVLDPENASVVSETVLTASGWTEWARTPPMGPFRIPGGTDHFYGIAFTPTEGILAWTRDGGVDVTATVPVWDGPGG